jgi:hypothetical protein
VEADGAAEARDEAELDAARLRRSDEARGERHGVDDAVLAPVVAERAEVLRVARAPEDLGRLEEEPAVDPEV